MPRKMTTAEREAFLAALHVGVLSVNEGDGKSPLAVPVWYAYEPGGLVTILTGLQTRKAKAIMAAGGFTLTVQDEQPPYKYVAVSGPVAETVEVADMGERLAMAQRYLGEEGGRGFIAATGSQPNTTIRLRPTRWLTSDFTE